MSITLNEVHLTKGKILTAFAYIEHLISLFITVHYFKAKQEKFLEEVMEHEYFSFELKKRILYKILANHHPTTSFPKKELTELQNIRNLVAHGALAGIVVGNKKVQPIFRHQGKDHQIEETFTEWERLNKLVESAVKKLPGIKLTSFEAPFN